MLPSSNVVSNTFIESRWLWNKKSQRYAYCNSVLDMMFWTWQILKLHFLKEKWSLTQTKITQKKFKKIWKKIQNVSFDKWIEYFFKFEALFDKLIEFFLNLKHYHSIGIYGHICLSNFKCTQEILDYTRWHVATLFLVIFPAISYYNFEILR